eukprot:jgi/Bigna1/78579/fgenesh1_pg.55_\
MPASCVKEQALPIRLHDPDLIHLVAFDRLDSPSRQGEVAPQAAGKPGAMHGGRLLFVAKTSYSVPNSWFSLHFYCTTTIISLSLFTNIRLRIFGRRKPPPHPLAAPFSRSRRMGAFPVDSVGEITHAHLKMNQGGGLMGLLGMEGYEDSSDNSMQVTADTKKENAAADRLRALARRSLGNSGGGGGGAGGGRAARGTTREEQGASEANRYRITHSLLMSCWVKYNPSLKPLLDQDKGVPRSLEGKADKQFRYVAAGHAKDRDGSKVWGTKDHSTKAKICGSLIIKITVTITICCFFGAILSEFSKTEFKKLLRNRSMYEVRIDTTWESMHAHLEATLKGNEHYDALGFVEIKMAFEDYIRELKTLVRAVKRAKRLKEKKEALEKRKRKKKKKRTTKENVSFDSQQMQASSSSSKRRGIIIRRERMKKREEEAGHMLTSEDDHREFERRRLLRRARRRKKKKKKKKKKKSSRLEKKTVVTCSHDEEDPELSSPSSLADISDAARRQGCKRRMRGENMARGGFAMLTDPSSSGMQQRQSDALEQEGGASEGGNNRGGCEEASHAMDIHPSSNALYRPRKRVRHHNHRGVGGDGELGGGGAQWEERKRRRRRRPAKRYIISSNSSSSSSSNIKARSSTMKTRIMRGAIQATMTAAAAVPSSSHMEEDSNVSEDGQERRDRGGRQEVDDNGKELGGGGRGAGGGGGRGGRQRRGGGGGGGLQRTNTITSDEDATAATVAHIMDGEEEGGIDERPQLATIQQHRVASEIAILGDPYSRRHHLEHRRSHYRGHSGTRRKMRDRRTLTGPGRCSPQHLHNCRRMEDEDDENVVDRSCSSSVNTSTWI